MFNNDLMADVHFVVGPPGGTQRLPGHKVSNSRITGLVLRFTERDLLRKPGIRGGQLADVRQCMFYLVPVKAEPLQRALATLNFFLCSFYPALYPTQKHALLTLQSLGTCCDRLGKSYVHSFPRNQLNKLFFSSFIL